MELDAIAQRCTAAYTSGEVDRIIRNSPAAVPAIPTAITPNQKLPQVARLFSHTIRCTPASVRLAAATIDQMMVTQLMRRAGARPLRVEG
jgi:hypothetical protein